jgi:hypothetical protein
MEEMDPPDILIKRGKRRRGVDGKLIVHPTEMLPERPLLPSHFSKKKGGERKGRIDEKDAIGSAQSQHQVLFSLDHAVPPVQGKIDNLGRPRVHG